MTDERLQQGDEEYVPEDDRVIGVAFKWSLVAVVVIAAIVAVVVLTSRDETEEPAIIERAPVAPPSRLVEAPAGRPSVRFVDVTEATGITFQHFNGATGEKLLPETMGSGAAFFDRDGDGDQDLLLINATSWPHDDRQTPAPTLALYDNDGTGQFTDVTSASGLDVSLYGCGVACGDVDGDGDVDLFISALGRNRLFVNDGGRFRDATDQAGLAGSDEDWSSSAGFFDADTDGDLDLFVTNYVRWSAEIDRQLGFTLNGTDRAYGPPKLYRGTYPSFYRNDGTGRFVDASAEAGVRVDNPASGEPAGKGLALTFIDVGRDGRLDVAVANDTVQNFLFRNEGDGTFAEVGMVSGFAFDDSGMATGAMGIDAADCGNDGAIALGIGNFANESSSLYVEQRNPWRFSDRANAEGIGSPSRLKLSFGLFFFDFDLDGRLDMLQANGHLEDEINEIQPSQHYRQAAQLFWNRGSSSSSMYVAIPEDELGDLATPIVGRGASYADIDGDGDLDVLLTQVAGRPYLFRNDRQTDHHWLRVRLRGTGGNTDAIGAWAELEAGGMTQRRQVMPTRSYLSQVELPLTFGLGPATTVARLEITWPDGERQTVPVTEVDREIVVTR